MYRDPTVSMPFSESERAYVESGRVGRLATADECGRPNVVPFCYALLEDALVSPLDEKPKGRDVRDLRRVRDIEANPFVAVVIDDYSPDWTDLVWVQLRGQATLVDSDDDSHPGAVATLREKYDQYADHDIDTRPLVWITPGHVRSWGL